MKVTVVSRSDANGGAAVVSRRLTEALREQGVEARMLVADARFPDSVRVRYPFRKPLAFLAERLQIFLHNGFSRKNLFKTDTGIFGLPLWRHPLIKDADMVILNWVNQGMLSLKGVRKICRSGKKVVWTMHDMWNLTGVCHHAMECREFTGECSTCPLISHRLCHKTWHRKKDLYDGTDITFVAVSSWLAEKAMESTLLKDREVAVIPNAIRVKEGSASLRAETPTARILFAAATLDNWIKGLDTFRDAVAIFARKYPELAERAVVALMGGVKNKGAIEGFALPVDYIGTVAGDDRLAEEYCRADVTVNCSSFENLPGTLIEGQAYGAIPVAFDRGGQRDIIDHLSTGYLAEWDDNPEKRAEAIADGMAWALSHPNGIRERMRRNVENRFSYTAVAKSYLNMMNTQRGN